jgi:mono/diheme cytochrome c family protein
MSMPDRSSRRRARIALLCVVVGLVVVGCGDDESSDAEQAAGSEVDGAELYQQSCASCHGADLRGTDKGPSHLSEVYEPGHHPDASFRAAIERGSPAHHWDFGDMPPVPGLDAAEVDAVIAYVRAQQAAQGLEPYPPR